MEEIQYKLRKKNAILTVNAISKLVDTIESKAASQPNNIHELAELKLLKVKCMDKEPLICITACQGIISLVEHGILGVIPTLSSFISSLPQVRNYAGIVPSVGALLVTDLRARLSEKDCYKCPFILKNPQHPFVTILKQNRDAWPDVLSVMQSISAHPDQIVAENSLELLRPVFLHALCDPALVSLPYRQQMWRLLLDTTCRHGRKEILVDILSWLLVESEVEVVGASHLFLELVELVLRNEDGAVCTALAPFVAMLAHRLTIHGHDPQACLRTLSQLLAVGPEASSCVLMILARTIGSCPVIYLKDIVNFCVSLSEQKTCNAMATKMVVCALLQWLLYPSYLTGEALQLSTSLLARVDSGAPWASNTGRLCANKLFSQLRSTDPLVASTSELCRLAESWQSNPSSVLDWLQRVENVPPGVMNQLQLFVSAMFIHDFEESEAKLQAFNLLLKMVDSNSDLAGDVITLIVYKLAQEKEPTAQLEYLRGLTKMAIQKENVNLIVHTLESMKSKQSMKPVLVDLYVRLWKVEPRCYPYLQKLLLESPIDGKAWEFDLARALAIREICEISPEQHGAELVKLLSQILNLCGSDEGGVLSAVALEGITALCRVEVVNIGTTWQALAPKLSRDKRPVVIKSLCELFGCALSMECTGRDYDKLVADIVTRLWSYVTTSKDPDVRDSAFKALSKAYVDKLSLKTLPECYRQRLQLPPSYAKTPVDAARKPEDVLPYIPCECWVQLLQNTLPESLDSAGRTLAAWLNTELSLYRSSIYTIATAKGEPPNYSYLKPYSVCRGLVDYLQRISDSPVDPAKLPVAKQCLCLLGRKLVKPLPPVSWTFLKAFLEDPELQEPTLALAIKQSATSPSARKIVENYLISLEPTLEYEKTLRYLYEQLADLCRGVPPNVLKPLVESSLSLAMEGDGCESLLKYLLSEIKSTLKRDDIHSANRDQLSLIVEGLLDKFDANSNMFDAYVDCATELTSKYLERMSSPSVLWEVTPAKLRQSLGIRSALARKGEGDVPLVWLNECIDSTLELVGEHSSTLLCIAHVQSCIRSHESNSKWALELLGQIQNVINKKTESDKQQATVFLCDIFLVSIIVLSGYNCLVPSLEYVSSSRENRLQLFPQALATLLATEQWKPMAVQVLEWLYHMLNLNAVTPLYTSTFLRGIMAMRHHNHIKTSWTRFVSCTLNSG